MKNKFRALLPILLLCAMSVSWVPATAAAAVPSTAATQPSVPPSENASAPTEPQAKDGGSAGIIITVLVILVALAVGAGAFYFIKRRKTARRVIPKGALPC